MARIAASMCERLGSGYRRLMTDATGKLRPNNLLSAAARGVVAAAGSTVAAGLSVLLVASWFVVGMIDGFGQHWVAVLHAVASAVTLVMVFFIQHTNGVETRAILLKLDELIRATDGASEQLIAAEHRPLHEQERLEQR
jgi:low affinity Fe/Cu permease